MEDPNYIILPCNCYLCSKKCLEDFFKKFNFQQKSSQYDKNRVSYICICSQEYFNYDVLEIAQIFYEHGLKNDSKKALYLYDTNKIYYCAKCQKPLNKEEYQKSKEINWDKLNINKDDKLIKFLKDNKITGFLCNKCYSKKD